MTSPWPHDDNAALIAFYGNPAVGAWATANLVQIVPPWSMQYKGDDGKVTPIRHFLIHRKCFDSLGRVFAAIWKAYGQDQKRIEAIGLHWFGGSYAPRNVRGSEDKLSCHALAAAIDLDPEHEPMNRTHASYMLPDVIAAFKAEGWYWGGDFHTRQDPMHFQAAHE